MVLPILVLRCGVQPSEVGKLTLHQLDILLNSQASGNYVPMADERAVDRMLAAMGQI